MHRVSVAYDSSGDRRYNQPFAPSIYGPGFVQGDVVGVGYRPRSGTVFFTRNGKKLDDVAHGLRAQNLFPTVGATGPCHVHVNFGQLGFVFIEANVKKWGLAPMTGSLAPPPPYGSEHGSILLEGGRDRSGDEHECEPTASWMMAAAHAPRHVTTSFQPSHDRSISAQVRLVSQQPTSPGPQRSPTEISLAALSAIDFSSISHDGRFHDDAGEGTSGSARHAQKSGYGYAYVPVHAFAPHPTQQSAVDAGLHADSAVPPPDYDSTGLCLAAPTQSSTQRPRVESCDREGPPIPSYAAAIARRPPGTR